jgi:hypothetical protein
VAMKVMNYKYNIAKQLAKNDVEKGLQQALKVRQQHLCPSTHRSCTFGLIYVKIGNRECK